VRRYGATAAAALGLFSVLQSSTLWAADGDWVTEIDEDGLKVETREVAGSNYRAFRASIAVAATPAQVLARLDDVDSYPDWFPDTVEARRVPGEAGTSSNYVRTDAPWPVKDRDAIYTQRVEQSADEIIIRVGVSPDLVPETNDAVRVRRAEGRWNLQVIEGGTLVNWRFHLEPGGKIPSRTGQCPVC
jgi:hypothetical protein